MTTTTMPCPARRLKPLVPVAVRIDHLVYNYALGAGTLDIVTDDAAETYLLAAHRDGDRLVGMRLVKLSSGKAHDVDFTASPWRCDCGDAEFRPGRPGGCRHIVALRLAAERLRQAARPTEREVAA